MELGCWDTRLEGVFDDDILSVVQCGVNRWKAAPGGPCGAVRLLSP